MEEREREEILQDMRRLDQWESTPVAPSGRCSDMTPMEMQKLIDLLYDMLDKKEIEERRRDEREDRMLREIQRLNEALTRAEERASAAEKRAVAVESQRDEKGKR